MRTIRTATLIMIAVFAAGALGGCVEKTQPVPELTFAHSSPILLNVRVAEIERAPDGAPEARPEEKAELPVVDVEEERPSTGDTLEISHARAPQPRF